MNPKHEPWTIESMAAYADGELNPADRASFDAWLLVHPEARIELDAQKLFARKNQTFWHKASAPHPTEAQWNCVLDGVCNALQPNRPSYQEVRPIAWKRWVAACSTVAIAALVAVNFIGGPNSTRPPHVEKVVQFDPADAFEVASGGDVDIISVQGDDGSMVVVGLPPLPGILEMTTVGDVKLEAIVSDADGQPVKPGTLPTDLKKGLYINPADKTTPVP
jgi:hypothetical protein